MQDAKAPYQIVPVVSPVSNDPNTSGRIRNLPCGGGLQHPQVIRSPSSPGGWEVHPAWARKGWRLLRDMYLDEGNPDGWRLYEKYLDHWGKGLTRVSFPQSKLPAEVRDRQRACAPDEFADDFRVKPTTGAVAAPPADEPAKLSKRNPAPEARS